MNAQAAIHNDFQPIPGRQIVRDTSNDYVLLDFLTRHGWRITEINDRAGWYRAQRTCKPLKN